MSYLMTFDFSVKIIARNSRKIQVFPWAGVHYTFPAQALAPPGHLAVMKLLTLPSGSLVVATNQNMLLFKLLTFLGLLLTEACYCLGLFSIYSSCLLT